MRNTDCVLASLELLLIFPATLFMTALFARSIQPLQYEPAHSAQQIVNWYAALPHPIGLWIFLMGLPMVVLVTGGAQLLRRWKAEAELRQAARETVEVLRRYLTTAIIAGATLGAAGILGIVALHVLAD